MKKKVVTLTSAVLLTSTFATNALASTYTVQKGDTLSRIAGKYNTTVPTLKSLNQLTSDMIYINQVLQVGDTESSNGTTAGAAPTTTQVIYHTVVAGDSLSKIASQYGITLSDLRKWNNQTSDLIYPGQKFIVSAPGSNTTSTPAVATPAPTTPTSTAVTEYTVVRGDYLGKIASMFGLSVQELKTLNGLQSDLIYVGQKLIVSKNGDSSNPVPTTPSSNSSVVDIAKGLMGIPYIWGGSTLSGFDCSGYIYYVFNKAGKKMGRYSAEGYYSRAYYVDQPQVGDLVFFENTYKKGISHVGIYLGNNEFIHADSTKGVTITSLNNSYYKQHLDGFKRFY